MGDFIPPAPPSGPPSADRLDSWKDIAAYLKRDVSTVQRWEKREGLPIHRHLHHKLGSVYAFRSEIEAWWQARRLRLEHVERQTPEPAGSPPSASEPPPISSRAGRAWLLVPVVMVALGVAAGRWMTLPAADSRRPDIQSIAVLPLNNLSSDPAEDYFADGMTEALIAYLAGIHSLRVVSRTSVMRFKGTDLPVPRIARELNVDAIVEGSVQRAGDRVSIRVQLIHARSDTHLWARDFERDLVDILKLQSDVSRAVADEIRVQVTADERARLASAGTVNPAAHREYLLARFHLWKFRDEHLVRAIEHFERATQIDPAYASAYAGLGYAWWARGVFGGIGLKTAEAPARTAARRALELDDRLAEAYAVQGYLECIYDWDWARAEQTLTRALTLDPNNVDAHYTYALLLMALRRSDEAVSQIASAAERDPFSPQIHSTYGRVLYRARRYEEAIAPLRHAIELDSANAGAYYRLGDVYEQMDRFDDAIAAYQRAHQLTGYDAARSFKLARVYARTGDHLEARRILDAVEATASREPADANAAAAYAALGETDKAFRTLSRLVEERNRLTIFIKQEPSLQVLHADPRWEVLLEPMNFPR